MSNNQNKYIALPGGKECKLKNPHQKLGGWPEVIGTAWLAFEKRNPVLPITEVMPEGETFRGEIEYRVNRKEYLGTTGKYFDAKMQFKDNWIIVTKEQYNVFSNEETIKAGLDFQPTIAIKPLKAKEPVKFNPAQFVSMDMENHKLKPLLDVVENKETVDLNDLFNAIEQGQKEHLYLLSKVNQDANMENHDGYFDYQTAAESCDAVTKLRELSANWQQSNSIEGIVGFVLEWVAKNVEIKYEHIEALDFNCPFVDTQKIIDMKSDIIKEYNNGK